jgi:outer membrane receptor protein involved in Fe transport
MHSKRTTKLTRLAGLSLAAAATAGTGQVATAQETVDSLDEVVVTTARQREEALQDVPASITAITSDTLEAANVQRAGDFIRLTPGVSLVQSAEVADGQVNIRGINGARDAENSFALIIDGILITNPAALNREYSDLKQMEIVKGPQGAIYGRNAASGAIIVTTTKPGQEFSGNAKVGYGEDNTITGAFSFGGPLSDRAGWKLGADYRKTDGFFRNITLGEKVVDDYEGFNVSGRIVFEPSDSSSLDIKARYGEVDAAAIAFNAAFQLPGFTFSGLPNAAVQRRRERTHNFQFVNNIDPTNDQETSRFPRSTSRTCPSASSRPGRSIARWTTRSARTAPAARSASSIPSRPARTRPRRSWPPDSSAIAASADHLLRGTEHAAECDLRALHARRLRRHAVPGSQSDGLQRRAASGLQRRPAPALAHRPVLPEHRS